MPLRAAAASSRTSGRPLARRPSPAPGCIGSRDGWKDLIRMTQEPAMQQAIDKAKNAVHLRIRRLSQQSSWHQSVFIEPAALAKDRCVKRRSDGKLC